MNEYKTTCTCGNIVNADVGDTIINNTYRWHLSYRCPICSNTVELDDSGIGSLPADIKEIIISQHGKWAICADNPSTKTKIKFMLRKLGLQDKYPLSEDNSNIIMKGTQAEMTWIAGKFAEKHITTIQIKKL